VVEQPAPSAACRESAETALSLPPAPAERIIGLVCLLLTLLLPLPWPLAM
jgi:hypothetical protein